MLCRAHDQFWSFKKRQGCREGKTEHKLKSSAWINRNIEHTTSLAAFQKALKHVEIGLANNEPGCWWRECQQPLSCTWTHCPYPGLRPPLASRDLTKGMYRDYIIRLVIHKGTARLGTIGGGILRKIWGAAIAWAYHDYEVLLAPCAISKLLVSFHCICNRISRILVEKYGRGWRSLMLQ